MLAALLLKPYFKDILRTSRTYFLNVVCEFSVKFFLFSVRTINKSVGKKANLPSPLDVQKLKGFQLQGSFAP